MRTLKARKSKIEWPKTAILMKIGMLVIVWYFFGFPTTGFFFYFLCVPRLCAVPENIHTSQQKRMEFNGGSEGAGGSLRTETLKKCMKLHWHFQRSGGLRKKSLPWGSYGYFLKLHCTQWLVCMRPKLILVPVALSNYNTLQTLAWEWTQTTWFKVQYANCFHKINSKIIEQVYNKLPASTVQQLRWRSYLSSNLTLASLLALRFKAGSLKMSLLMICLSRLTSTEYLWERNDM